MKTQGEVEATICEGVAHFMQEFMGRGPKEIRTHLVGNQLLVRLLGILTPAETSLAAVQPPEKGRDMLKSVRTYLLETSRSRIDALVQESTGLRCISMHHDISTITGEEVFVFTLSSEMDLREPKRK
jgi:uncharacterized protein YbcI